MFVRYDTNQNLFRLRIMAHIVLSTKQKMTSLLDVNGKQEIVSVDQLKAAHLDATTQSTASQLQPTASFYHPFVYIPFDTE